MKPREAVEWALYYPPLVDPRPESYPPVAARDIIGLSSQRSPRGLRRLGARLGRASAPSPLRTSNWPWRFETRTRPSNTQSSANEAETPIRLDEGTTLIFPASEPEKSFLLKLIEGVVHVLSRVPQALTIETPIVRADVEGTEFVLGVSDAGWRAE